jgi:site-specific DNA recombinase
MRVAIYVRVSTPRQQQAQTIEQQVSRLRTFVAEQAGWSLQEEHIFRDDGYSGAKLNRPGLDALRTQAARAAFELVLITAPDRLSRSYVQQMVLLEELAQRGCRVQSIDRPLSDDPNEHLLVQIRSAVAEYERTVIADRMRRGREAKLQRGQLLPWTSAPYGYAMDPERPRDPAGLRIAAVQGALVQELFGRYSEGGVSLYALAQTLTARQVPSPSGKPHWTPSSVRGILTNPCYTGWAVSGRWQTVAARQRHSALLPVGSGESSRPRPASEWIRIGVPALVSAEQFAQVQRRLATNRQGAMRSTKHDYLLRGLVSCGVCRLACSGRWLHAEAASYHYYVCRGKQNPVSSCREARCRARYSPADQLDALAWDDLCQVLQQPELVMAALARAQAGAWLPEALQRRQATLRKTRASVQRQRERLLEGYLAGALDLPGFRRKDEALRQQQADLQVQEEELAAQGQRVVELSAVAASMTDVCARLRQGLGQATFVQRRQLVELLIDRVVVTDGTVEIRYVIPTTEASTQTRFCHLRTDYLDRPAQPRDPRQLGQRRPFRAEGPVVRHLGRVAWCAPR